MFAGHAADILYFVGLKSTDLPKRFTLSCHYYALLGCIKLEGKHVPTCIALVLLSQEEIDELGKTQVSRFSDKKDAWVMNCFFHS